MIKKYLLLVCAIMAFACHTMAGSLSKKMIQIEVGMSKAKVQNIFGTPKTRQIYNNSEERWEYREFNTLYFEGRPVTVETTVQIELSYGKVKQMLSFDNLIRIPVHFGSGGEIIPDVVDNRLYLPDPTISPTDFNILSIQGADFKRFLKRVQEANFDNDRLKMIVSDLHNTELTSNQLRSLLKTFDFDSGRLNLLKEMSCVITDPINIEEALATFDFKSNKDQARELLRKKKFRRS